MSALYSAAIVSTVRRERSRDEARAERVDVVQLCFSSIGGGVVEIEDADDCANVGEAHVEEMQVTVDDGGRHRWRDEPGPRLYDGGDHVRRRRCCRQDGDGSV